jgi:hypothetical protein
MHGMTNLGEKQHGKITTVVMGSDRQMSTLAVIQSRFPNGSILTASGQSVLANQLAMTAN